MNAKSALIVCAFLSPCLWTATLPLPPAIQDAVRIGLSAQGLNLPGIQSTGTDPQGNVYVLVSASPGEFVYPQKTVLGLGPESVIVIKVAPATGQLIYMTGIAGPASTFGGMHVAMCVGGDGSVYLAGFADAATFPGTPGSFKPSIAGSSAFLLKLAPSGSSLAYSTFLDGAQTTRALAVAVDPAGNAYVGGTTGGDTFPVTPGTYQTTRPPAGTGLIGDGVGFLAKVDPRGQQVLAATFFGNTTRIDALAIDANQQVQAKGWTESGDFPTTPGAPYPLQGYANEAFLSRFSPDLSTLRNSTLLPGFDWLHPQFSSDGSAAFILQETSGFKLETFGPDGHIASDLALNHAPYVFLGNGQFLEWYRQTNSVAPRDTLFPCVPNIAGATSATVGSAITVFDQTGAVLLGSLLPFDIQAVWTDPQGRIFAAAFSTWDAGTGLVSGTLSQSLLIFRLDLSEVEHGKTAPACITNAASFAPGALAPGAFATMFGSSLGPQQGVSFGLDAQGRAPKELGGVSVTVGGVTAPITYVQDGQINFITPAGLGGNSTDVCVLGAAGQKCVYSQLAPVSPGVFRSSSGYTVLNQDNSLNTAANPAPRGSVVQIFGTGFGALSRPVADGAVIGMPLDYLSNSVQAWFVYQCPGGMFGFCDPPVQAEVQFSGAAPFKLNGVDQINVRIPTATPSNAIQTETSELRIVTGPGTYVATPVGIFIGH